MCAPRTVGPCGCPAVTERRQPRPRHGPAVRPHPARVPRTHASVWGSRSLVSVRGAPRPSLWERWEPRPVQAGTAGCRLHLERRAPGRRRAGAMLILRLTSWTDTPHPQPAGAPQHPSPSRLAPSAGPERGALGLGAGNSQAAGRGRTPWGPSPVPARLSWLGRPAGLAWAGAPTAVGCSARRVTAFCTQAGASPHACSYHLDLSQYRCQLRPAAVTVRLVLHAGRGDLCPQGTRGQARGLSPVPVGAALASGGQGVHRAHTAAAGVRTGPCPQGHFRRAVWVSPAPASRPICTGSQGCREAHDQVQSGPGQPCPPSTAPGS